jgi:hypothetical protein
MSVWVGADLGPGLEIARSLPDLDLLDIAYAASRGGARGILFPLAGFGRTTKYSAELFDRPGLPLLTVSATIDELGTHDGFASAIDRILVTEERGQALRNFNRIAEFRSQLTGAAQELAGLVEPEPTMLKEFARTKAQWVFFQTNHICDAVNVQEAEAELARLSAATLIANKLNLRVALIGPMGRDYSAALASMPHVEEVFPTPDLWLIALRVGWERAIAEFRSFMH